MAKSAPGKHFREGLSLLDITRMFPDNAAAEQWIAHSRWGDKPSCPHCGGMNVQIGAKHPSQPYRCREKGCRKFFSVKTGTVMADSNLSYQTWAIATYLLATGLKGQASMKLHRDLGITQKAAWFLAHRLREAWNEQQVGPFEGPIEVDETYVGGRKDRKLPGRGPVGKTAVVGAKDRATGQVVAHVVENMTKETLQDFVETVTLRKEGGPKVYTDGASAYRGIPNHEWVEHSVGEYVRGQVHTNGIESFWSMLKRGYKGVYHKMSPKHLDRYVNEFAGRHNVRPLHTIDQMQDIIRGLEGKRLRYEDLTADNGLPAGAR